MQKDLAERIVQDRHLICLGNELSEPRQWQWQWQWQRQWHQLPGIE
jgi:hypothetical protein